MVTNDAGKFYLKVERGCKPHVRLFKESRNAQITIPCNQTTKWPPIRVKVNRDLTILVQKLEQQYKITVQRIMEQKPEICIYVNALTYERDIRTCVRYINTHLSHVGIAGPNLEVAGRIKGDKVTFESTFGALHTNSKLSARSVVLKAPHIFIKPEALYSCSKLRMFSRRVQIDGRICGLENDPLKLSVDIDSSLLHIGIDGSIGTSRSSAEKSSTESAVSVLNFRLSGCLANFGQIISQKQMEFCVDGSILSLQDGHIDSASRGFTALKHIKGISSEVSDSLPTSSTLSSAILCEKPEAVAQLLENGVDVNDSIKEGSADEDTPRRIAARKYKAVSTTESRNKMREKITLIQALISTHEWKRGIITSNIINAKVGQNCSDCAQFRSTNLTMTIYGNAKCETKSIWTSGQIKHASLDVSCGGNIIAAEESLISQDRWVKIHASVLCVAGFWSVGEEFSIYVNSATFLEESHIEVDSFEGTVNENCYHSGSWQSRFILLTIKENFFTLHTGKVIVHETTIIEAKSFNTCGIWNIKESIKVTLKGSANFYPSSKFSANLLKLIAEGQCTIAGHIFLANLSVYVRNDLITTLDARVIISTSATIAAGTFRNDSYWQSDGNLHMHLACFEQSENALIFVKDTFTIAIYDLSEERCQGRIVANYLIMNLMKKVRLDSYIRVNQIEISLPYVNESQLTIAGHLEVLKGPVIMKGKSILQNLEYSSNEIDYANFCYPAFILKGQLKAEAVIAPFLILQFSTASYCFLSGMDSVVQKATYRSLISCSLLHTEPASLISSISAQETPLPEGISCATTWLHEGQVRFNAEKVYIICDQFINRGRLTSDNKLQNHMHEIIVLVDSLFQNDAVFSADKIEIRGNGEMHNRNRIFANDRMDICLANYTSEYGQRQVESLQPKLLSAGKEERSRTRNRVEKRSNVLVPQVNNLFALNQQMKTNLIQSQVLIDSDIIDERKKIAFVARDGILLNSSIIVDQLEFTLGTAYITEIVVKHKIPVKVNQLHISGNCKYLSLIINGELFCKSMVIDSSIRQIKIIGNGVFSCEKTCNIKGESVILTTRDIRLNELMASMVTITSNGILNLSPPFGSECKTVLINSDSCQLQGRILVDHKIILRSGLGACLISGEILGMCRRSELSLECGELIITGTVTNLDFFESYTKTKMKHCETGLIKSVKNIVLEGEYISLNGKIMHSESVIISGDEVNIEGILKSLDNTEVVYSVFAKKIVFDGKIYGPARFDLNGYEINFSGISNNLKSLDIDANLTVITPLEMYCENFDLMAYSAILRGNFNATNFQTNAQTTIFLQSDLTGCKKCMLVAPLILALKCSLPDEINICALISIYEQSQSQSQLLLQPDNNFAVFTNEKSRLQAKSECSQAQTKVFSESELSSTTHSLQQQDFIRITNNQLVVQSFIKIIFYSDSNQYKNVYHRELLRKCMNDISKCFQNAYTTYDELQEALEKATNMQPITISLLTTDHLYQLLLNILSEVHIDHSAMCNLPKILSVLCNATNIADYSNAANMIAIYEMPDNIKFDAQILHEMSNHFRIRSRKFVPLPNECRSVEDDIGYASRSSSEEIDEKQRSLNETYSVNLNDESQMLMSKVISEDDCMDNGTITDDDLPSVPTTQFGSKTQINCSSEVLIDNNGEHTESSSSNTRYVLNGDRQVPIGYINFDRLDVVITKPSAISPRKTHSRTDLAFKKIQMKSILPKLELHSFDSESSLASFDEISTPKWYSTPLKRSLIPRAAISTSFNAATKLRLLPSCSTQL
ncbi:unnamed protein product [Thelazia callipaeda]|uniref:ANK_REP_REGION domain-containing protein n=1 Tax=Thelazia callipaeda TaxID=103827 RepID=A0A0N5CYT6_THECL|nr:unnamed protein product [Thelazia callipaeda]